MVNDEKMARIVNQETLMMSLLIDRYSILMKSRYMEQVTNKEVLSIASLFRVVGHPSRIQIIYLLNTKPTCVCEIAKELNLNKSVTSKHLSQLKQVGVIEMKKTGTQVMCSIAMPCIISMMECAIHPEKRTLGVTTLPLCRKGCE